jgi:hypothetical protein
MEDIIKYGWEKALLLGEIPQCLNGDGSPMKEKDLFKRFPIFSKETFYSLVDQLVNDGLLLREEAQ